MMDAAARLAQAARAERAKLVRAWRAERAKLAGKVHDAPTALRPYSNRPLAIGFYLSTDDYVTTTASCRFAGGGLCGPKDGPVTVFKKALGPYPTEAAARSALKQSLVCQSGYWGPQGSWGGGWYWLQNNVTTGDCKSVKVL